MPSLVIVESPIKAKTIEKYLNEENSKKYIVIASGGHVKNLPEKQFGISINNHVVTGEYVILPSAKKFISRVKEILTYANEVFMCTDDDREGERICEDIVKVCNITSYYRFAPREITENSIKNAIFNKVEVRQIDEKVITAQKVRREEDRILGYGLSPIIRWYSKRDKNEIKTYGTGRVEAIALDILYQRHLLIEEYKYNKPLPTNKIKAFYKYNGIPFELNGEKLEFQQDEYEELEKSKSLAMQNPHIVSEVIPEIEDYPPRPPLITSSLYSNASYAYGFEPSFTKKLAQELFYSGAINYPRTDSYMIADEKVEDIIAYHKETISIENQDDIKLEKREYKNKKGAQAAHEAIRPSCIDVNHSPSHVLETWKQSNKTSSLNENHFKIYELIWNYTVATQLENSKYDQTEIIVRAGSLVFKDKANECIYRGWEKYHGLLINAASREDKDKWKGKEKIFPKDLFVGKVLENVTIDSYEKPSRAPKRISSGGLISMLENLQVARPSTMHTIASKIIKKSYSTNDSNLLSITKSGVFVAKFNEEYAPELIDRKEASSFEDLLQKIEKGEITDTNNILEECWNYIETVKKRVGFVEYDKREPTEKQIQYAKKIYECLTDEEKEKVPSDTFEFFEKTKDFISKNEAIEKEIALQNSLGKCPKCKKDTIVAKGEVFKCLSDKCSFVLYKNGIKKLFSSMKKELSDDDIVSMVSTILKDKVVYMTALNTQYGTKDTYFELSYSKIYKSYSFSFVKNRKDIDEKLGRWENFRNIDSKNKKEIKNLENEVMKLSKTNKRLKNDMRKDTLTRAFNKPALRCDLQKLINNKNNSKVNNKIFVAYFDGDNFKKINDTYGHKSGDDVLIGLVDTCFLGIRYFNASGNVYRMGGDEFVIVFYGVQTDEVQNYLEMIKKSINSKKFGEKKVKASISIGFAEFGEHDDVDSLCDKADQALYIAKKKGKNTLHKYNALVSE